jgi:hypothetical protein
MSTRGKFGLAATASALALGAGPAAAPALSSPARGHWSFIQGQRRALKFTVSFNVHSVGFDVRLPNSVKATGVSAQGFSCHVTFFLLVSCRGSLPANRSASGIVHFNKNAQRGLGGHVHGYTGGPGVKGTLTGP